MKYTILGFNQELVSMITAIRVDKNGKTKEVRLDIVDLVILREIADFMNRKKVIKYTIDDKTFFSVQYKIILEDLPILNIKTQALSDRLDKMVLLNLIEKKVIRNQQGTFTAFRLTDTYEELQYNSESSRLRYQEYQTTSANVVDYEPKDKSTNNKSTNTNNKENSKKKFDFRSAIISLGVEENVCDDWLQVRKTKRASNTETAYKRICAEIYASGISANECITIAAENSWQGFKAEWLNNLINRNNGQANNNPSNDKQQRMQGYAETLAGMLQQVERNRADGKFGQRTDNEDLCW